MPTPPLSVEVARETIERVETKLRQGFRPSGLTGSGPAAISEAARDAVTDGFVRTTKAFVSRVATARDLYGIEVDSSLYRPIVYHQPVPRSVVTPAPAPPRELLKPRGKGESILAIGDLHQCPNHEHRVEVLKWIARFASERRFDRIIQIGDWSTWDSVNFHDRNDSYKAKTKPPIKQDMENLDASLKMWRANIAEDYKPKQDIVLGNHENRLERFENMNPESYGIFTGQRDQLFAGWGWRTRPYGEIMYVEGVGFTHHPINGAGRAFGGETGPQRAANKSTVPIVSGHTHKRQLHDSGKIGPCASISMVEIGCGLPWGEVESYAKHGITGWWWGVVPMRVCNGVITDIEFKSMLALEAEYGG